MPKKYDVFAAIIEHAPCKAKDLPFKARIYAHLRKLKEENKIEERNGKLIPLSNHETKCLFNIIKYSIKNGLDYNKLLSKNMPEIISELFDNYPSLRTKKLSNNKENTSLIKYLEENQFILLTKNRPKEGVILDHQIFRNILSLNHITKKKRKTTFFELSDLILKIKTDPVNPFDKNVFEFLSGSAQLEGSTITLGETIDLIVRDIYPEKSKKDVQMVKNLNEAMYYILENLNKEITVEDIKNLNKLVLFSLHRSAGKFKKSHNKIQGNPSFKTAPPLQVPLLMDRYCSKIKNIKNRTEVISKIGHLHNELQRIHPFTDGNSRTTRMIINWILLKNDFPLLVLKMGCFDEYMNLTKLSKSREDKELSHLFQHILLHESLLKKH